MKIVNVCFKRPPRLWGSIVGPQSICMDTPEDARNWLVECGPGAEWITLRATDANPLRQKMKMERRHWLIGLRDVDSIMMEEPEPIQAVEPAPPVELEGQTSREIVMAQKAIADTREPVAMPLKLDPEAVKGVSFPVTQNGKPPKKK